MGIVDQVIPSSLVDLVNCILNVSGVLVLSCVIKPYLIIPCFILAAAAVPIREFYIRTARAIQRLDSVARSPVYDHVSTTLHGLAAVRAFRMEHKLEDQFYRYINDSVACRFFVMSTQRALGFLMDFLSNMYILAVACVVLTAKDSLSGGDGGLMLSSSLQIMGFFQYCIRLSCDLETQMISCERVLEYGNIAPEAELKIEGREPDPLWPRRGAIVLEKVFLWYSKDKPPVLNDINLRIDPRQKIGVVGRTGAGKSTLVSMLFRLVEPEGKILIDDMDIQTLGLHDVRNKISIIPQDPVIFSGTIRHNLDPFGQHSADSLWNALQESNLDIAIKSMPGALDAQVSEGGSNLSVGQRQLLCLARALLKNSKILVCDEATANVDLETDELIRQTIRTKFNHCTVLTVAHRLNTIIDADKVVVMDAGRVVEFDEPHVLLTNGKGVFTAMVNETGVENANMLRKHAHDAQVNRQKLSENGK
jgi:ATP-binding cassette subfamily C (CFTR/MRP) protein 4